MPTPTPTPTPLAQFTHKIFKELKKNTHRIFHKKWPTKTTKSNEEHEIALNVETRQRVSSKSQIHQSRIPSMDLSEPLQTNEASPTKQIFILSGQSNMAGRGGVDKHKHWDGVVPPECAADSSKIFRLNAHLSWEVAREPLHYDIDTEKTCGVGPGMSFSNSVKDSVGVIGLVPCAVGGTAIKEWARGGHLYDNMVKRAKAAVDSGGEIKALLWYQGESDATSQHDVDCYKENMERLIHNVRGDLGLPSLPIIQVAIASGDIKYLEKIREIQKGIDLPNVVCVDAKGLQLKEDNLHLTTEAQVQLGHFLAQTYLTHFLAQD